jgi:hypothetical protein
MEFQIDSNFNDLDLNTESDSGSEDEIINMNEIKKT